MLELGRTLNEYLFSFAIMYVWSAFGLAALTASVVILAKRRRRTILAFAVVNTGVILLAWGGASWVEVFGKISCWTIFGGIVLFFVYGFIMAAPIALVLIGAESIILGMGYLAPPPLEVMTEPALIIVGVLLLLTGTFAMIFKRAFPPSYPYCL